MLLPIIAYTCCMKNSIKFHDLTPLITFLLISEVKKMAKNFLVLQNLSFYIFSYRKHLFLAGHIDFISFIFCLL